MQSKKGVAEGIIQFAIGLLLFVIIVVNVILPTVGQGAAASGNTSAGYSSVWPTLITLVGTVTIFGLVIYAAKAA